MMLISVDYSGHVGHDEKLRDSLRKSYLATNSDTWLPEEFMPNLADKFDIVSGEGVESELLDAFRFAPTYGILDLLAISSFS